jgi:hypothetical protein
VTEVDVVVVEVREVVVIGAGGVAIGADGVAIGGEGAVKGEGEVAEEVSSPRGLLLANIRNFSPLTYKCTP